MLLLLAQMGKPSYQFFSFSDCDTDCRITTKHCIIRQVKEEGFTCECISTAADCKQLSDDFGACISENEPTHGGSKIWTDYNKLYPIPKPQPSEKSVCSTWIVLNAAQATSTVLAALTVLLIRIFKKRDSDDYQQIESPESPYRPTTENVVEQ
jgi:hypothetical protein